MKEFLSGSDYQPSEEYQELDALFHETLDALTSRYSALPVVPHFASHFNAEKLMRTYRQSEAPLRSIRFHDRQAYVFFFNETQEVPSYDFIHFIDRPTRDASDIIYDALLIGDRDRTYGIRQQGLLEVVSSPRCSAGLRAVHDLVQTERLNGWPNTFSHKEIHDAKHKNGFDLETLQAHDRFL